jgi:hypothetical protein
VIKLKGINLLNSGNKMLAYAKMIVDKVCMPVRIEIAVSRVLSQVTTEVPNGPAISNLRVTAHRIRVNTEIFVSYEKYYFSNGCSTFGSIFSIQQLFKKLRTQPNTKVRFPSTQQHGYTINQYSDWIFNVACLGLQATIIRQLL